jgi:kynurenine formamidase
MKLIDLSRELQHRSPAHPSHPPIALATWYDHSEVKIAGNTRFSSKALFLSMSDHAGTHVDAPCHFNPDPSAASIDQLPLEDFFTEAICLDLSHAPLKHEITVAEMEQALARSGQEITRARPTTRRTLPAPDAASPISSASGTWRPWSGRGASG